MSNFNELLKRDGIKTIVTRFFNKIDSFNTKYSITDLDYKIKEQPVKPAAYYIENSLTASHLIELSYRLNGESEVKYATFEIPKEIDGAFIIGGAYRIATNTLDGDFDCRIRMSDVGNQYINFDYNRKYDIKKGVLKIKRQNELNPTVSERAIEIKYEDIDKLTGEKKELLKLTDIQIKKFQIKLDLDYKPEYISTKLIDDCLAFGDDRLKDLIIDKRIDSVYTSFMNFLFRSSNGSNYISARRRITGYFTKYNKIQEEVTAITTLAFRFFKGTSESKGDSNLQVPPGINAINLDSLGNKIQVSESTAYNSTFSDLIDLADTPINNNANKQNALTVSTHITDDGVMFDVYDKEFNKITIPYIDYLNSKVCASEFVDYDKKILKPNESGQVEIKYRMKRKMANVDEIDLIDLHPDYRLSATTRRIPFINSTDSVRISMGAAMLKQSIPLVNAQRPLVDTGHDEELKNNILNEKFEYDEGKVVNIDSDKVTVRLNDGTDVDIQRRTAIQSLNDISIYTEPKVKVGQKVKKGDIITGAVGLQEDTYKSGLNTLVLFHAMFGLVNEDALVVSESYAKRMSHYSLVDIRLNIKTSSALKWIIPIGTKVRSGDSLVTYYAARRLDEINKALNEKLGGLFGEETKKDLSQYTTEERYKVPNNIDEAYVSDVLIQKQEKPKIPKSVKVDYKFATTSEPVIEEYNKTKDRSVIFDKFPEYVASDNLDPIVMDRDDYKVVYTVRIRLIKVTSLMIGSKVTNRYGGKGVISSILPDELMPIMVDKNTGKQYRVEVVMNPYSTINRKIAGVLLEESLGLIAHRLYELVEDYKKTKTGMKKIMPLITKYYPGRYDKLSVEDFLKLHNTKPIEDVYYFNVGCYSEFTPTKVEAWMDELGVESQSEILMPESSVTDLEELKSNLTAEEYEKVVKGMTGKFVPVDKKLQCGWMTLIELHHIPSYSCKVTSSLFGNDAFHDVNPKKDEPIMGQGRYRATGQKINEMELSALLSRNARPFIDKAREAVTTEDNQLFLNNLLGLGLMVVNDEGYGVGGSSLREDTNKMKNKFRAGKSKNN